MLSLNHYNCLVGRQWCVALKDSRSSRSGLQSMCQHHGDSPGERERKHRKKTSKKKERPRERKEKENPVAVSCFPWFLEFL